MKLLSIILIVIMLFSSFCKAEVESSDAFVFRNGIHWGMSKNDVIALEGSDYIDIGDELHYMDARVSTYNGSLGYGFTNNSLTVAMYGIFQYEKEDYTNLLSAYRAKYGDEIESSFYEFIELAKVPITSDPYVSELYHNPQYVRWDLPDGTKIIMHWIGECENSEKDRSIEGSYNIFITYFSPEYQDLDNGEVDLTGV